MKNNRVGLWVAGAVVLVAVIVGVVGLLWPRPGETPPAATDNTSQPSTPTGNGACATALPASTTSTVPADLRWAASQGITWPVSDTVGPTSSASGFPACFQQSPIGAALFATGFFATSADFSLGDLVEHYFVASSQKDQLLAAAAATAEPQGFAQQLKSIGANYVGYRIDGFQNATADVTVVLSVPNTATGFRGIKLSLVWTDGDWRIKEIPSGGGNNIFFDVLDGQFTKWSA